MDIVGSFQTSVRRALREIDPEYESYPGLVCCGSHDVTDAEIIINKIRVAREQGIPFLGICYGHQLAAIEFARNVLGIKDATSEEMSTTGYFVVRKRADGLNVGLKGGESYWNNFEVDSHLNWPKPKNFITVQFHPEYESSLDNPHPILLEFLRLCSVG